MWYGSPLRPKILSFRCMLTPPCLTCAASSPRWSTLGPSSWDNPRHMYWMRELVLPNKELGPSQLWVRVHLPEGVPGDNNFSVEGGNTCAGNTNHWDYLPAQRQVHLQVRGAVGDPPIRLPTSPHHHRWLRNPKSTPIPLQESQILQIGTHKGWVTKEDSQSPPAEEAKRIGQPICYQYCQPFRNNASKQSHASSPKSWPIHSQKD